MPSRTRAPAVPSTRRPVAHPSTLPLCDSSYTHPSAPALHRRRFINVMTLDFLTLSALAPFWMSNDATLRRWEGRDSLLPLLSVLPVLGPCIYLCLRPRAKL